MQAKVTASSATLAALKEEVLLQLQQRLDKACKGGRKYVCSLPDMAVFRLLLEDVRVGKTDKAKTVRGATKQVSTSKKLRESFVWEPARFSQPADSEDEDASTTPSSGGYFTELRLYVDASKVSIVDSMASPSPIKVRMSSLTHSLTHSLTPARRSVCRPL